MQNKFIISVIVCTYNRSDLLSLCLESLARQTLDKNLYEVIVVNNNSNDNTEEIIRNFTDKYSNFSSIVETKQGLSHSRNCGWKNSNGNYIAYIDDDAIAFENWLEGIFDFVVINPDIKVFGGPYEGYSNKKLPWWLPRTYGSMTLGDFSKIIEFGIEWISGSNMIYHRTILEKFGGFENSVGMSGNKISYGEETNLQQKIITTNIPIWYSPDIKVKHLIAEKKLRFSWVFISGYKAGKVDEIIFNHKHNLFYYSILIIFHFFKFGIKLINLKNFGLNSYKLLHTLSYDVGMIMCKIRRNL